MENNNVELVAEPKIESRFGFGQKTSYAKSRTAKIGAAVSLVSIISVFLFDSPTPVAIKEEGILIPDSSQITSSYNTLDIETYSPVKESINQDKNKKIASTTKARNFPGLQRIERKRIGSVPPGTIIRARLITGASNGLVRAETLEAIRILGETYLPSNTTLLGVGQSGEERLTVKFTKAVFRDGNVQSIEAQAADMEDQTVGLTGSKVGKYATKYASAVGLNFVGGMAEGLQDREIVGQQVLTKPNAKNALLNGASKAALEMANETMSDLKNSNPAIQVPAGQEILVLFEDKN
tara:strand:+ start:39750 stop:40631 length:882 start_codon:yes stop_codon:yes gene_type:complete